MIICLILFGIQLLIPVAAMIREWGEDERFEREKLIYRS